jgi:hypothetical protein
MSRQEEHQVPFATIFTLAENRGAAHPPSASLAALAVAAKAAAEAAGFFVNSQRGLAATTWSSCLRF